MAEGGGCGRVRRVGVDRRGKESTEYKESVTKGGRRTHRCEVQSDMYRKSWG